MRGMRNKRFINFSIATIFILYLIRHFCDSIRPTISPLQVRDTRVQPRKVITLLSCTYLMLINVLFVCITIHFMNMVVIFCLYEISRYFDIIFVAVRDGLTDFFIAFPIAVDMVVPITQVLQLPQHRLHTQSQCQGVLWTGSDLS